MVTTINKLDELTDRQHHNNAAASAGTIELHDDFHSKDTRDLHDSAVSKLKATSSAAIETQADSLKAARDAANEATLPDVKKIHEKRAADIEKQMKKDAETVYKSHAKAVEAHNKATKAIDKETAETIKKLQAEHKANKEVVRKSSKPDPDKVKLLEDMENRHIENIEATTALATKKKEALAEHLESSTKAVKEIEGHSGIKAGSLANAATAAKAGSMTEGAYKDLGAIEKVTKGVEASWKSGTGGKMAIVGGIAGLGSAFAGGKDLLVPEVDAQTGERKNSLVKDALMVGGGVGLMLLARGHGERTLIGR